MARHRRPVGAATPLELLMFDPAEWADPADGLEDWRAVERWRDARRAYSKTHPDSELGSVLDQMRYERWVRGRRAGWKMPDLYPWGA